MSLANKLFGGGAKAVLKQYCGTDEIVFYPDFDDRDTFLRLEKQLVDLSYELGTNEEDGDGAITRSERGDRERSTGRLSIEKRLIQEHCVTEKSVFYINGELWHVQRRDAADVGSDGAYNTYRITKTEPRKSFNTRIQQSRPVKDR